MTMNLGYPRVRSLLGPFVQLALLSFAICATPMREFASFFLLSVKFWPIFLFVFAPPILGVFALEWYRASQQGRGPLMPAARMVAMIAGMLVGSFLGLNFFPGES